MILFISIGLAVLGLVALVATVRDSLKRMQQCREEWEEAND